MRNFLTTGSSEFCHIKGRSLLHYRAAAIIAERDRTSLTEARSKIYSSLPNTEDWPEAKLYNLYAREGLSILRKYPLLSLKCTLRGIFYMLVGPGDTQLAKYLGLKDYVEKTGAMGDVFRLSFQQYISKWFFERTLQFAIFIFSITYLLFLYSGAICSLWQIISEEEKRIFVHLFLWWVMLYFLIVSGGPEAYARLRVPIMPLLSIYAGAGLVRLKFLRRKEAIGCT